MGLPADSVGPAMKPAFLGSHTLFSESTLLCLKASSFLVASACFWPVPNEAHTTKERLWHYSKLLHDSLTLLKHYLGTSWEPLVHHLDITLALLRHYFGRTFPVLGNDSGTTLGLLEDYMGTT